MAIRSFGDCDTKSFFNTGRLKKGIRWVTVQRIAKRKLDILNYASTLTDLKSPPGNRLEALVGNLIGYYSIRINSQWRVIFKWTEFGPEKVRIIDYHR